MSTLTSNQQINALLEEVDGLVAEFIGHTIREFFIANPWAKLVSFDCCTASHLYNYDVNFQEEQIDDNNSTFTTFGWYHCCITYDKTNENISQKMYELSKTLFEVDNKLIMKVMKNRIITFCREDYV